MGQKKRRRPSERLLSRACRDGASGPHGSSEAYWLEPVEPVVAVCAGGAAFGTLT